MAKLQTLLSTVGPCKCLKDMVEFIGVANTNDELADEGMESCA